MSAIRIYTDGACLNNPGPGGWAALLIDQDRETVVSGGAKFTTNNRMEMQAAIEGLRALPDRSEIDLYTDSKYLYLGITGYIENWRRNYWKTSTKKPVKNQELWIELDRLSQRHSIVWHWVKAHSGHPENERVDSLAREQAIQFAV